MSRQIEESHRDELKDLDESERESISRLITWLASRDDQFDEDELGFLEDLADLLEIEPEAPEEVLAGPEALRTHPRCRNRRLDSSRRGMR